MNKIEHKIPAILILCNGCICLLFTKSIYSLLPTLLGVMMILRGCSMFLAGIRQKEFLNTERGNIGFSIVSMIIGTGMLIKQNDAIFIVGVFWGMYSFRKASVQCNELIHKRKDLRETYKQNIRLILQMIVGYVMSTALIFDPFTKTEHHIVLLGFELIYEGLMEMITELEKRKEQIQ